MIYYSPHRKAHRRWRGPTRLCRTTVAVPFLFLITVTVVLCGLLKMSNMGTSLLSSSSGQPVLDIHTEPQPGGGAGAGAQDHDAQEAKKPEPKKHTYTYTYETMEGYFLQDEASTVPSEFDFLSTNFGLIDRAYESDGSLANGGRDSTPWQRFEHHISTLNREARQNAGEGEGAAEELSSRTRYILFFLGRHGNGYHNVAESYYGNVAWDCHFSALDGDLDRIMTWSDAHLSREGRRQAREVNTFWHSQTSPEGSQKMSLPQVYLVSPLDRTLETAKITFDGLFPARSNSGSDESAFDAIVVEKIREGTGIHTCDRRSSKSYIRSTYPRYNTDMDPSLTELDEFWDPDRREPNSALTQRQREFFDELMQTPALLGAADERVSITSHSGAIAAMLRVLGHREFSLNTGAVIPVFVRVVRQQQAAANSEGHKKSTQKRHGGSGEGGHGDPTLDLPDLEAAGTISSSSSDRSQWQPIPSCPADLDLDTVGKTRWGMGLKKFLDGVEQGTLP